MKTAVLIALVELAVLGSARAQDAAPPAPEAMTIEEARKLVEWGETRFPRNLAAKQFEAVAISVTMAAEWHGKDPVVKAYKVAGPRLILLIDQGGREKPGGKLVVDFLAKYGADGAAVLEKENVHLLAMGDAAQQALVKHGMNATWLLMEFNEAPAAGLVKVSQSGARRMVLLGAELRKTNRERHAPALFSAIGQRGEQGINFIWERRKDLADEVAMEVFLEKPSAYIRGQRDLKADVAERKEKMGLSE